MKHAHMHEEEEEEEESIVIGWISFLCSNAFNIKTFTIKFANEIFSERNVGNFISYSVH